MRDRRFAFVALLLALAVALIYGQVRDHAFLNFDDDLYLTANPLVTGPLSWEAFGAAFRFRAANWHPLTWVSHVVDWRLFGPWAGGHLLVNALLHALNAVAVLAVLRAATGAFWPAAIVAALFAVHPLRVESVAWASERKDVLSALLWLLATAAYLRYVRRPGPRRLAAVAGLHGLALLAKPMPVTLPFALLLLDWWPLGRAAVRGAPGTPRTAGGAWPALVREKWPLFALSLVSVLLSFRAQTTAIAPYVHPGLPERLANAAVSYALYLRDFAWPHGLSFLYPYPRHGVPPAALAGAAALLLLLTFLSLRRARPWLAVGWLWYLGTLVPVIGLVQLGAQSRADRYTYLPLLGVAVGLVWAGAQGLPRRAAVRAAPAVVAALAALAWSAWSYAGAWADSASLAAAAVRSTRDNFIALNNLGSALSDAGRAAEAVPYLEEALRVKPDHCNARYNLGANLAVLGRHREARDELAAALGCYRAARARRDYLVDTEVLLGGTCQALGLPAEAAGHYEAALALAPSDRDAREGLARARALAPAGR